MPAIRFAFQPASHLLPKLIASTIPVLSQLAMSLVLIGCPPFQGGLEQPTSGPGFTQLAEEHVPRHLGRDSLKVLPDALLFVSLAVPTLQLMQKIRGRLPTFHGFGQGFGQAVLLLCIGFRPLQI